MLFLLCFPMPGKIDTRERREKEEGKERIHNVLLSFSQPRVKTDTKGRKEGGGERKDLQRTSLFQTDELRQTQRKEKRKKMKKVPIVFPLFQHQELTAMEHSAIRRHQGVRGSRRHGATSLCVPPFLARHREAPQSRCLHLQKGTICRWGGCRCRTPGGKGKEDEERGGRKKAKKGNEKKRDRGEERGKKERNRCKRGKEKRRMIKMKETKRKQGVKKTARR